jgi:tetratricopeptide (TPR) repeat protein
MLALAKIYAADSNLQNSIQYCHEALKLFKNENDSYYEGILDTLNTMSNSYRREQKYDEAFNCVEIGLSYFKNQDTSKLIFNSPIEWPVGRSTMGHLHQKLLVSKLYLLMKQTNSSEEAERIYEELVESFQNYPNSRLEKEVEINYRKESKFDKCGRAEQYKYSDMKFYRTIKF